MNLKRSLVAVVVFAVLPASAAPTCKERVDALKSLAVRLKPEQGSWSRGPVAITLNGYDSPKSQAERQGDDYKTRGVRLMAPVDFVFEADVALGLGRALLELTAETRVELCVPQNAPIEKKLSLEADAKLLAPLLAEVGPAPAIDRATMLAAHVEREPWGCKGIPGSFAAVQYVTPADRLAIIADEIAESLTGCGCPAAEAERIFALVSLMADVWNDKEGCAPLIIGKAPTAKSVALEGPVMNLVKAMTAAGAAGVTFPATPPRPEKKKGR